MISNRIFAWILLTVGMAGIASVLHLACLTGGFEDAAGSPESLIELRLALVSPQKAFRPERIRVFPGQHVELTVSNQAARDSRFVCDWVLSSPGAVTKVIASGISATGEAKEPGITGITGILAGTPRVAPGEVKTVVFQAPREAGEYPFVCTVADHWKRVKGVLEVRH